MKKDKKAKLKKRRILIKDSVRTQLYGFLFFLPWLIGFLALFITPFFMTLKFSFNELSYGDQGGLVYKGVGFKNYGWVFGEFKIKDELFFIRHLFNSITEVVLLLPAITVFSLVFAVILNQKFKGRGLARVIFFIPIIFGLPAIADAFSSQPDISEYALTLKDNKMYNFFNIMKLFETSSFAPELFGTISKLVKMTFKIIMLSGVQTLIFIAAIQSINPTLYEVAEIEGATKYEQFFKITLPSIFPMLSAVLIYTLIDLLYRSPITKLILETKYSLHIRATISVIFTIITFVFLGVVVLILRLSWGGSDERKKVKQK